MAGNTADGADGSPVGRQLAFVEQEVRSELRIRTRRRDADRRRAFALQISTVGLSAVITVLLGVQVGEPTRQWLSDVALGLGAAITVLAAWQAFFSHRALWLQRSDTVHRLAALERRLAFHRAGPAGADPEPAQVAEFLAAYEEIVQADHDAWARVRSASDPQVAQSPVAAPSRTPVLPAARQEPPA
ncbi:SLATT domain-containing protein [Streptomyces sp. NRRL B-24484]|uniref:SLATT domain-containing protein n=1 Tax=Streptomyces sp. NRRL B-24484 TaxID=1463833 RepID=UPI0004BF91CF|nr:SLATT domain-containing protein [Streptomyces sp. NRRL B-24484]